MKRRSKTGRRGHARPSSKSVASPSSREHKAHAPSAVSAFVVTCSDTREGKADESGQLLRDLLERAGHRVLGQAWVKDEPIEIRGAVERAIAAGARAVLLTGGTGIGRRDSTAEVVESLFEKRLPGFGELFRFLSFEEVGSPAMLSRAAAGTCRGAVLFALPGSPNAVRLAAERLILPELGHLIRELDR